MNDAPVHCLIYAPYSFNGRGVPESCSSIVENFPEHLVPELYVARTRIPVAPNGHVHEALPPLIRRLPWRMIAERADGAVERAFATALRRQDPADSVAYIWPGAPISMIHAARARGIPVVRQMINTACATSGPILDAAYQELGLPPKHPVTAEAIAKESAELQEFDYILAPSAEVEASLTAIGIPAERILPTSFGWNAGRFAGSAVASRPEHGIRALFVGSIEVRKGIPDLLAAWQDADIDGELVLAGAIEPAIASLVDRHVATGKVQVAGFVNDLGPLYRSADIFVLPSREEGAPRVTYEAAGCGLPIITTPMGAARLVDDGQNGILVRPGDRQQLTDALRRLGFDPELRAAYGARAKRAAAAFDYQHVGLLHGRMLADIAFHRLPESSVSRRDV